LTDAVRGGERREDDNQNRVEAMVAEYNEQDCGEQTQRIELRACSVVVQCACFEEVQTN